MSFFGKGASALCVCALGFFLLGAANAPGVPGLPLPGNAAMIFNPGTGDYSGFRIVVQPDGRAISIDGAGHGSSQLESDVVQKFFADLSAASPLSDLKSAPCSSSAGDNAPTTVEVNSAIVITFKGQQSAALSCVTDPRAQRLLLDATQIQHSLYVAAYRKRNLLTYGTQYQAASQYAAQGYLSDYHFSFDNFYTGGFQNTPFSFSSFTMDHFTNGMSTVNPFVGLPYSGSPYSSLPLASLPYASPYSGLPYGNPYVGAPYSSTAWGSSPFVSLPYASPSTGTPFYSQSAPPQ